MGGGDVRSRRPCGLPTWPRVGAGAWGRRVAGREGPTTGRRAGCGACASGPVAAVAGPGGRPTEGGTASAPKNQQQRARDGKGRAGRGGVWRIAGAAGVVEQLPRPGAEHRSEAEPAKRSPGQPGPKTAPTR